MANLPPLEPGDIAPRFVLPTADGAGRFDSLDDTLAGKPMVLAFAPEPGAELTQALLRRAPEFGASGATARAVLRRGAKDLGELAAVDGKGDVTAFFAPKGQAVLVIARNGHLFQRLEGDGGDVVERALGMVQAMAAEATSRPAERQAPVLIVPDVLSKVDCQRLITVYHMDGNVFEEPGHGVKNRTTDYKMRIPEYGRKDRIDHWVINQKTMSFISDRLERRLFPEIQKAFHYKITRHESYRIGCYEGERGGELHGHRDNVQPNVAHRRFACSINLNAEDFEGGELVFPEFGGQRFSPRTGEAIVFSSSILHEPLHVTSGRRLVLLAFLFGDT